MQPLTFRPILKRIRWGGRRLGDLLGKPIGAESDYAESWEVADHGRDQSVVLAGPCSGMTLHEVVVRQNLPLFGSHKGVGQFPLLVKFLDANDVLSVQVHPDDRLAKEFDPDENGKTEVWVILDAQDDSELYVGLRQGVTEQDVRSALQSGSIPSLLHRLSVRAGDCVFVPAGTVHSIGAGILLAEVQQSSDLTFRLYDWDRVGADGKPRELHIEQALRCIDFTRGPIGKAVPRKVPAEHFLEELVRVPEFVLRRHQTRTPFDLPADNQFRVLMSLAGNSRLICGNNVYSLSRGQTILLPADRSSVTIEPSNDITLIDASLP